MQVKDIVVKMEKGERKRKRKWERGKGEGREGRRIGHWGWKELLI
jgi:hypothetical protein